MRTANPALNSRTFSQYGTAAYGERMTIEGTVMKAAILLVLMLIPATWMWGQVMNTWGGPVPGVAVFGGLIGGLVFGMATVFRKEWAPVTAPLYAVCEGLLLGALSAMFERQYKGIVMQAVALTGGTLFCLLLAYRSGLIRATENFKLGIVAATGAIFLIYLATWILRMFGVGMPYIHGNGTIGIVFSLVVVTVAALNLVLDFDFIEQGAEQGAPKFMEWYGAFGLMVTLVWLYLEILRLLAKLNSRD